MKIFEGYSDCDLIYATRSESLAYQKGLRASQGPVWVVEIELDTVPVREKVYDTLRDFGKEYGV